MSEPHVVTPQEAQEALRDFAGSPSTFLARVTRTVATEPERTRAAVVAVLRDAVEHAPGLADDRRLEHWLMRRADAIEKGADW